MTGVILLLYLHCRSCYTKQVPRSCIWNMLMRMQRLDHLGWDCLSHSG